MTKKTKKTSKPAKDTMSADQRKIAFAHAYLANNRKGPQAAISVGFAPKSAHVTASRLLKNAKVLAIIEEANKKAGVMAGLSVERTLLEVARLAYSDPGKLYDAEGKRIPVHLLDEDTRATIAGIEEEELFTGEGKERTLAGHLRKIKQHSKVHALDMAMKHHKLYDEGSQNAGTTIINKIYYGKKQNEKG